GENKVQEMTDKQAQLPNDILWHQVGTLQRNKVKYLAPYVHLVHSVESLKLLQEIEKEAAKNQRTINVLLQLHIAQEETKAGLNEDELRILMTDKSLESMKHTRIKGLMGMATFTKDENQIAKEFRGLRQLFEKIQGEFGNHPLCELDTLSMGMSGDYRIAIEEGSTLIRVGSAIFGERNYAV
ncbi:MAG: YggS family pyridoxal phosphate-dependent enzyme, partial [Bacteroidota bacterium]|nr:YggS family pyridoxal phosphate-dependent enzyme [Bacteroidota bacterium]MDX5429637.1 YggS family pyridoxal phosphate-dependent enzyme [Bacteroidota bacterium]MDX5468418.1 YggS family pyridoxal phosphate-dependent enzyme [Bacteroidota bacterium]